MTTRRLSLLIAASAVALTTGVLVAPVAAAVPPPSEACTFTDNPPQGGASSYPYAHRIAGPNRYETSVCASFDFPWLDHDQSGAPPIEVADAVVLARGDVYADALAGAPLATRMDGPLLLTSPTVLRPEVKAEMQRVLAPGKPVYLLGSTASLSQGVEDAVRAAGFVPHRIAGADRYETAVKIAEAMPDAKNFYFTTGLDFPDALSAGEVAAASNQVIPGYPNSFGDSAVLFTKGDTVPAVTAAFADSRRDETNPGAWYTVGTAADQGVVAQFGTGDLVDRYVGHDRYETASILAEHSFAGGGELNTNMLALVDGTNFPDALTGSSFMGKKGGFMLLTKPTTLPPPTAAFLRAHANDSMGGWIIDVIGGTSSVQDSVAHAAVVAMTPTS
jgi:putative cell wall-binding protein